MIFNFIYKTKIRTFKQEKAIWGITTITIKKNAGRVNSFVEKENIRMGLFSVIRRKRRLRGLVRAKKALIIISQ